MESELIIHNVEDDGAWKRIFDRAVANRKYLGELVTKF